jgi:3-hydroxybutyryl-CoA dehydrogenase
MARQFQSAAVIGTGMMGPGIALTLALGGVRSTIISRTEKGAAEGVEKAAAQLKTLGEHGLAADVEEAAGRISGSADLENSVSGVDLVIESAPEDMEFKKDLFARLDRAARPDAILATNTSGLSITEIQSACTKRERVLTAHFWNPPYLMPLVEIVRGAQTSAAAAEDLRALLEHCGKVVVMVKKDRPGQLGNRLQMAMWREAAYIVQEGIADVEDVDNAIKFGFGLRLPVYGAFEHGDIVGWTISGAVMEYASADLYNEPRAPKIVKDMMARGDLGASTGKGFYDWSKKDVHAVKARRDAFVLDFLKRWRSA